MPIRKFQSPTGRVYKLDVPDNTPDDAVYQYVNTLFERDEAKRNKTATQDIVTGLKKDIAGIPSTITGLMDIPVATITGKPMVSQGWEAIGELTGFQPAKYAENLGYQYSPELERQRAQQQAAFAQPGIAGLLAGAKETITNPRLLGTMAAESLPSTLLGGPIAKSAKLAPIIGEGLMAAGQMASQLGKDNALTGKELLGTVGAGVGTAGLGALGARLTKKLGGTDIDTALTGARPLTQAEVQMLSSIPERGMLNRAARSAASEGLFEEPLQSMQEQAWQNYAADRPISEGVGQAGVEGGILGGLMGGGFGAISSDDVSQAKTIAAQQQEQDTLARAQQRAPQLEALSRANLTGQEPELVGGATASLVPMEELGKTKEGVDTIIKNIKSYYPDYDKNELNIARQELRASKKLLPTNEEYRLQQKQSELEQVFPPDPYAVTPDVTKQLGIESRKVKQTLLSVPDYTDMDAMRKAIDGLNNYAESTGSVRGTEDALKAVDFLTSKLEMVSPQGQLNLLPRPSDVPVEPQVQAQEESTTDNKNQGKLFTTRGLPTKAADNRMVDKSGQLNLFPSETPPKQRMEDNNEQVIEPENARQPAQRKLFDSRGRPVSSNRSGQGGASELNLQGTERVMGEDVLAESTDQPKINEPVSGEYGLAGGVDGGRDGGSDVPAGAESAALAPRKKEKTLQQFKNQLKRADPVVEWDEMVDGEYDYTALRQEEKEAWEDAVKSGDASYDVAKTLSQQSRKLAGGNKRAEAISKKYEPIVTDDAELEALDTKQLNDARNPDMNTEGIESIERQFASATAAGEWLAKNAKDKKIQTVMAQIKPYLTNTRIVYVTGDVKISKRVARRFVDNGAIGVTETLPSGETIVYIVPALKGSNSEITIAHELLHAATTRRLMQPNLRAKFERLRKDFITSIESVGLDEGQLAFTKDALFNADEFLTYTMTSPSVKAIAEKVVVGGESMWRRITNFIAELFSKDAKFMDAVNTLIGKRSVMSALDNLLNETLQVSPETVAFSKNRINEASAASPAAQQQAEQLIAGMAGSTIRRAPKPTTTTTQAVRNVMRTMKADPIGTTLGYLDSAYDTVASKVVWRGAALARDVQDLNQGAFRDAYGNVRADLALSQNENSENLIDATFTLGGVKIDNGLVAAEPAQHSVDGIFRAAKQLTDRIGLDVGRQLITDTLFHWRAAAIIQMGPQAYPQNWVANPSLIPNKSQIQAAMDAFNQFPELAEIRDQFNGSKNNTVQFLYDTGFLTKEKYETYMKDNSYAPWFRIMEYEDTVKGQGNIGRVVNLGQMRALKGGEEEVNDMLENMAQFIAWGIRSGASNYTANNALQTLTDAGMATRHNSPPPGVDQRAVVMTYVNGKRAYWVPDNPLHFAALQAVPAIRSTVLSMGSSFTRMFRNMIVLFPTFPITQVIHDSFRAYAESGVNKPRQLVGEILRAFVGGDALRGTHRDVDILKRYGVVGEVDYNILDTTRGRVEKFNLEAAKDKNAISKVAHAAYQHLHKFSYSADLAVRLGIYRQTMKETGDMQLAATRAREIINFRKAGTSQATNAMKQIIPFLGASLQGMDVLYRTATGRGNSMQERKAAFKAFAGNMMMLSAMTVLYTMMQSGDDEYEEQKGYVTDYNYMLPGGYLMPVPADIGLFFKVIPERITDYLLSEGTDSPESSERLKEGIAAAMARALFPPTTVSVITPVIELNLNKSFFSDLPIVGRQQEQYEPQEQYTESTSELAIQIGKTTGQSPMQIDHILRSIGGTTAGLVSGSIDMLMSDRVARPKDPLLGRFYTTEVGGRETEEFYALRELVEKAEATAKKYEEENRLEDLEEYVGRKEVQSRLGMAGLVREVEGAIGEARKVKQSIRNDESLTPDERREQLDLVTEQIEQYMKMVGVRNLRAIAENKE